MKKKKPSAQPQTNPDTQAISAGDVMRRLSALETQVHAFHRQTDVQLNALLSSIRKTMALVNGFTQIDGVPIVEQPPASAPPAAVVPAKVPAPAAPAPAAPAPAAPAPASPDLPVAPQTAPVAANASDGNPISVISVGMGTVAQVPADQDVNNLPHLLHDNPSTATAPNVASASTQSAPPQAAPTPPAAQPAAPQKAVPTGQPAAKAKPVVERDPLEDVLISPSGTAKNRVTPPTAKSPTSRSIPRPLAGDTEDLGSSTLAGLDATDLKSLLERKVKQMAESEDSKMPTASTPLSSPMETQSLTLTAEELAELRQKGKKKGAPEKGKPVNTGSVPYPSEVQQTKKSMFALKRVAQELIENPIIPDTTDLISVELRNELSWYSRLILEDFLTMHERHKRRATERFESLAKYDSTLTDPALFWDSDAIKEYIHYRSIAYVEKYLDQLEKEIQESGDKRYYKLLDYLAQVVGLDRISVEIGYEAYSADKHQLAPSQPSFSRNTTDDQMVTELVMSGYLDTENNTVVRKPVVIVGTPVEDPFDDFFADLQSGMEIGTSDSVSLDDEDDDSWQPVLQTPDLDQNFGGSSSDEVQRVSMPDPEPIGEVPFPEEVAHCQNLIYNLRMSVTNTNQLGQLPRSGDFLDDDISELMTKASNDFFRDFTLFHKGYQEKAQLRYQTIAGNQMDPYDPDHYWPEEVVHGYYHMRTMRFIESFLDPLEARMIAKRLANHGELLDQLALDMEMARIGIAPGVTMFDGSRHALPSSSTVPPNADLRSIPIHAVIKSGYTDLTTGLVARKSIVTVQLRPFRRTNG